MLLRLFESNLFMLLRLFDGEAAADRNGLDRSSIEPGDTAAAEGVGRHVPSANAFSADGGGGGGGGAEEDGDGPTIRMNRGSDITLRTPCCATRKAHVSGEAAIFS